MRWRIAFAGAQHETNTFAPARAGAAEFEMADSWPPLLRGTEADTGTRGMNLPIAGALAEARARGDIDCLPLLWCAAEPSGPVTDAAFEMICDIILDGLAKAGPVDAVCLDLHGAMVTDSHADGEAALLRRLRDVLGPDLPIGVSLDLHANISAEFVALADCVTIYRTYPHLDMADTGARCLRRLVQRLEGQTWVPAFRQAPFLVPLQAQATGIAPCEALYQQIMAEEAETSYTDLALGFTAADIPDCGPSVLAYAGAQAQADALADVALARLLAAEAQFDTELHSPANAITRARAMPGEGPVILADVQDNPGAGGMSDTTGLLHALVAEGGQAVLGVLCDAETAAQARRAGEGARIMAALGAASGTCDTSPLTARFDVLRLSPGEIPYTGEMYGGGIATLGPSCLLQVVGTGVRVVVSSIRIQCLDRALFTHFGIEPRSEPLVAVKSTAHYRADFEPGARAVISVAAAGAFPCTLNADSYKALRPGVRLGPLGPVYTGPEQG